MKLTTIPYVHHTFNPWCGCTKASSGCQNCYAETLSRRNPKTLGIWGITGTRQITSDDYWKQPLKWNAEAKDKGTRYKVFCSSMADVFEKASTIPRGSREAVKAARQRLLDLIDQTPNLDWLLLTKRPDAIKKCLGSKKRNNVWLGVTVEDSDSMWRIDHLKNCAGLCALLFISAEPLLGPITLDLDGIDWLIVGGESGAKNKARKMDISWAVSLINQAIDFNIPCFYKQHGLLLAKDKGEKKNGSNPAVWNANDPWNIREFPLMVEADYFDYCDCDQCQKDRFYRNKEAMKSAGVTGKLVWKPVFGRAIHQRMESSEYAGVHIPIAYEVR